MSTTKERQHNYSRIIVEKGENNVSNKEALMQTLIESSRNRCRELGLDPYVIPSLNHIDGEALQNKLHDYRDVLHVVEFFIDKFLDTLEGTPLLVGVTDQNGVILLMKGDPSIKVMMSSLGFVPGSQFNEDVAGTNVVNIALSQNEPIQVIGQEHYHEFLHTVACYAAPFRYTLQNELLGSICIMTSIDLANKYLLAMLTTTVDTIERELAIQSEKKRLHLLNQVMMESTNNAKLITDKQGYVTEYNVMAKHLERFMGLRKSCHISECLQIGSYLGSVLAEGAKHENVEVSFWNEERKTHHVYLFDAFPIYDEHGVLNGALGQLRNITERVESEKLINKMAYYDDLTGLPNRRMLINRLEKEIKSHSEHKARLGIIQLDLDRFKVVNDTLSHTVGDMLIVEVSKRLESCLNEGDLVARIGGDEFTFLLPNRKNADDIIDMAEKIIHSFDKGITLTGYDYFATASIGVVVFPDDGTTVEDLMIHADNAMFRAKAAGGNTYKVFDPHIYSGRREQFQLEIHLQKAIENGELFLHYQPQIEGETFEIIGVEALVRWRHPELGVISPGKFIPIAEETGLIVPIGEWVLREACRQTKEWQDKGLPPIRVSVNLSSQQFERQDIVHTVSNILVDTGLSPKYLELEITETMTMDADKAIETLKKLEAIGVQIAIDDFGTGYSSLNYLKRFSIHRLKIDQSFVKDIMANPNDASIVGTIIAMAHRLGLKVIAEGVETKEQVDYLLNQECDELQGYYFSKPVESILIESMLQVAK